MLYGGAAAIIGYYLAKFWDTSIAGMMATAVGLLFIMTLCVQKFMDYKRKALVSKLEGA